jgi:hypothetical protein
VIQLLLGEDVMVCEVTMLSCVRHGYLSSSVFVVLSCVGRDLAMS